MAHSCAQFEIYRVLFFVVITLFVLQLVRTKQGTPSCSTVEIIFFFTFPFAGGHVRRRLRRDFLREGLAGRATSRAVDCHTNGSERCVSLI